VTRSKELNAEFLRNTLGLEISVGVYDGDTKSEKKSRIRDGVQRRNHELRRSESVSGESPPVGGLPLELLS